jgi:pyruvate carboxylase
MKITRMLIANRGEIALRIARSAADLHIPVVAIYSEDDAGSLHISAADEACALEGTGSAAYLDIEQIIGIARDKKCNAIHPGYGFLSENASFARRCADEGIAFIGPGPEILELFGNKAEAIIMAKKCSVPVLKVRRVVSAWKRPGRFFNRWDPGPRL